MTATSRDKIQSILWIMKYVSSTWTVVGNISYHIWEWCDDKVQRKLSLQTSCICACNNRYVVYAMNREFCDIWFCEHRGSKKCCDPSYIWTHSLEAPISRRHIGNKINIQPTTTSKRVLHGCRLYGSCTAGSNLTASYAKRSYATNSYLFVLT
jgi:hypothetical protein